MIGEVVGVDISSDECEASSEYRIVGRSRCVGADDAMSVGTGPVGEDGRN